jgi:hypothetical protein
LTLLDSDSVADRATLHGCLDAAIGALDCLALSPQHNHRKGHLMISQAVAVCSNFIRKAFLVEFNLEITTVLVIRVKHIAARTTTLSL